MSIEAYKWVWSLDVPCNLKLTLLCLADWCNAEGEGCHPSSRLLHDRLKLGERQIRKNLRDLESRGLLSTEANYMRDGERTRHQVGRQTSNSYRLPLHMDPAGFTKHPAPDDLAHPEPHAPPGGNSTTPQGGTGRPPRGGTPRPPLIHKKDPPAYPSVEDCDRPQRVGTPTAQVWDAYRHAYCDRYGVDPVRNATVNGQLSGLVRRLGAEEAPHVAAYYVRSNNGFYVRQCHAVGAMLRDAEKLRTEWATGRSITNTQAQDLDRRQSNAAAANEARENPGAQEARMTDDILELLAATAEVMGHQLTGPALAVMADDLSVYPVEDVRRALARTRRECQRFSLSVILERLPNGWPAADEAFASYPVDEAQSAVVTPEAMQAWDVASEVQEDQVAARMAFRATYDRLVSEARAAGKRPQWQLSLGWDAAGREQAAREAVNLGLITEDRLAELTHQPDAGPVAGLLTGKSDGAELAKDRLAQVKEALAAGKQQAEQAKAQRRAEREAYEARVEAERQRQVEAVLQTEQTSGIRES